MPPPSAGDEGSVSSRRGRYALRGSTHGSDRARVATRAACCPHRASGAAGGTWPQTREGRLGGPGQQGRRENQRTYAPPVVSSSEGPRCWPTCMRIGSHAGAERLSALRQARRVMRPHHLAALVLLPHRRGQQVQGPLRQFGSIPERDGKSTTYFLYEGMAEIYRQGSEWMPGSSLATCAITDGSYRFSSGVETGECHGIITHSQPAPSMRVCRRVLAPFSGICMYYEGRTIEFIPIQCSVPTALSNTVLWCKCRHLLFPQL